MCSNKNETVLYIVSECSTLAQREHKRCFCEKYKLDRTSKWYDNKPGVVENVDYKILWDAMIQCDKKIEARKPDIILVDKKNKEVKITDVAILGDVRVCEKELEKIDKYKPLKDEIAHLWKMRRVTVIPIVIGTLGVITTQFEKYVKEVGIEMHVEHVQKTALLGTARVLRLVLGS